VFVSAAALAFSYVHEKVLQLQEAAVNGAVTAAGVATARSGSSTIDPNVEDAKTARINSK
jgi:hypothetical protein